MNTYQEGGRLVDKQWRAHAKAKSSGRAAETSNWQLATGLGGDMARLR